MPTLRSGTTYSNEDGSQKSPSSRAVPKKLPAHSDILLSAHKKIHMHLTGIQTLPIGEFRKLVFICHKTPFSTQQDFLAAAKHILAPIYTSAPQGPDATNLLDGQSAEAAKATQSSEQEATNIQSQVELADPSNSSSLFSDTPNNNDNKDTVCGVTQTEESIIFPIEENENVPVDSQAPNVLKLRFDNPQNDEECLSFPLELLTNTNFVDTPRSPGNGDSGLENQNTESNLLSETPILEISSQNENASCPNPQRSSQLNHNANHLTDVNGGNDSATDASTLILTINTESAGNSGTSTYKEESDDIIDIIWKKPNTRRHLRSSIPKREKLSSNKNECLLTQSSTISNYRENFDLASERTIKNTLSNNDDSTAISNTQSGASTEHHISEYGLVSEDNSNVPEIISISSDTPDVEEIAIGDDLPSVAGAENECGNMAEESSETDCQEAIQNVNVNVYAKEVDLTNDLDRENTSLVFGPTSPRSSTTIIEGTPLINNKRPITSKKIKTRLPLKKIIPSAQVLTDSETVDIIIDETQYETSDDSPIFKKYGMSSPFQYRTRTNTGFNNYKSKGMSPRGSSSGTRHGNKPVKDALVMVIDVPNDDAQEHAESVSDNLVLINGVIAEEHDPMECSPPTTPDILSGDSSSSRQLEGKILQKRSVYKARWENMSISDKVSAKFANRFRVRIFEDPVEALINIDYKSNFNNFNFSRITDSEMYNQLKKSGKIAKRMDAALKKVVRQFVEKNNGDCAFELAKTSSCSDSETSDEDVEANKEWLKKFAGNTKHLAKNITGAICKKSPDASDSSWRSFFMDSKGVELHKYPKSEKHGEQIIEPILKKMSQFNWLEG